MGCLLNRNSQVKLGRPHHKIGRLPGGGLRQQHGRPRAHVLPVEDERRLLPRGLCLQHITAMEILRWGHPGTDSCRQAAVDSSTHPRTQLVAEYTGGRQMIACSHPFIACSPLVLRLLGAKWNT